MTDRRFVVNDPECNIDLIVKLLEIYQQHMEFVADLLHKANLKNTPVTRNAYLKAKNRVGINIRVAFNNYMQLHQMHFDVETALTAVKNIDLNYTPNNKNHLSIVT